MAEEEGEEKGEARLERRDKLLHMQRRIIIINNNYTTSREGCSHDITGIYVKHGAQGSLNEAVLRSL